MARPTTTPPSASAPRVGDPSARARGEELTEAISGNTTNNTIERAALLPGAAKRDGHPSPQTPEASAASESRAERSSYSENKQELIARQAYYRAERRGFAPGYELEDWLEAEREVLEKEGGTSLG